MHIEGKDIGSFAITGFVVVGLAFCAGAANLVKNGDFSGDEKAFRAVTKTNGGKVSLFREEYTWNGCGKLEIVKSDKDEKTGWVTHAACVWIGVENDCRGFAVKPNTKYRFSLEVRGEAISAGISGIEWTENADIWHGKTLKTTVGRIKPQKEWTRYQGTFKTGPNAAAAALQLQMWSSTRYTMEQLKIGDAVYFDNVSIEESEEDLGALLGGGGKSAAVAPVKSVLAAAEGAETDLVTDFHRLGSGTADEGVKTEFKVNALADAFRIRIRATVAGEDIVKGDEKNAWSGDSLEIFFAPVPGNGDRRYSQFAFNAAGAKFAGKGTGAADFGEWSLRQKSEGGVWSADVTIPYSALGYKAPPADGAVIGFNVGRSGIRSRRHWCWADTKEGFQDVGRFGRLVVRDWTKGLANFREDGATCSSRADFERLAAEGESAKVEAKFAKLKGKKLLVAPVPVTSDWAAPFLPPQIFNPPESIKLRGAVNETVPLPVAIANLTGKTSNYRVIIETCVEKPEAPERAWYNGTKGLRGFPGEQVIFRKAVEFKASDKDAEARHLDPLPKMDEACSITVASREAGVAWFDFDCTGVKPGVYSGRLRVIPLNEGAKFTSKGFHTRIYTQGDMVDLPVELEVLPVVLDRDPKIPMGFFQFASSEKMFKQMIDCGMRESQFSPWQFCFPWKDGKLDISARGDKIVNQVEMIRREKEWARKHGVKLTWFGGFGFYETCIQNVAWREKDASKHLAIWQDFMRGVKKVLNEDCGLDDSEYIIEVFDEPRGDNGGYRKVTDALRTMKEAVPTMRTALTMAAWLWPIEEMEKAAPCVDCWIMCHHGYFTGRDRLAFIAKEKAAGKRITHYTCSTSMRASLVNEYRGNAWFGELYGLDGNNFYWFSDAAGGYGQFNWKFTTEGAIAYHSFDDVIPSIRYMSMRQGMDDIRYLAALEKTRGSDPAVKKFLADAVRRVCIDRAHDPTEPDRVRAEAVELMLRR